MPARAMEQQRIAGLAVTEWSGPGPTVLALHGLGSSSRWWTSLAEALPDVRIIGPDLRGRGASSDVAGPPGLRYHALDMKLLADELDLRDVIVVGHSMGAFLAPIVAQQLGDRVSRLVLLDGGLPPKFPWFMRPRVVGATFRRNMRKTDRPWPDAGAFTKEAAGKALAGRPDLVPVLAKMMEYDLVGHPGALRPRIDAPHAVGDAVDTFFGPDVRPAMEALSVPAHLLAATAGPDDKAKPFLADSVIEEWTSRLPGLTAERVTANHLTLLFAPDVPKAVAA